MPKTPLKQKLLLIIFGVFLSLVFLEIGLRLAGAFVLYLQEQHNRLSFNPNEYRILCLGESTTALGGEDSYPSQLEEMLNAKNPPIKYSVINKGIISTTSDYILAHLEQNLDMYKPQLVIVMMGINDKAYMHGPYKALWWENIKYYLKDFRVYKLAHLLYEHISHRVKEINTPAQTVDVSRDDEEGYQQTEDFLKDIISKCVGRFSEHMSASAQWRKEGQLGQARQEEDFARQSIIEAGSASVELARRYRFQGRFQKAQDFLKQATLFNPKLPDLYQEWGEFSSAQGKSAEAVKAYQAALDLDPKNSEDLLGLARAYYQEHNDNAFLVYAGYLQSNPQDYWGYIQLAQWLRENKHEEVAQNYLSQAIKIGPDFDQAYLDMGQILDDQGQYQNEEAFYLKEISLRPQNPRLYQALGRFYRSRGKEDLAHEYFQKEALLEISEYNPATLFNYSLLLNKILSRPIKAVVMQYPLEDIGPLKDYLGQKNGVVFVENKQNFKEAVARGGYNRYFKDNFAYNFGHCTRRGNTLIAQNLTEVIKSLTEKIKKIE